MEDPVGPGPEAALAQPTPEQASDPGRLWGRAAAVVIVGLLLDQVTKWLAVNNLADQPGIRLLPTLELNLHYNTGFSFGTGRGSGPIIGAVVIFMTLYLANLIRKETNPRRSFLLAIILSGAIGNLLDRIWRAEDGLLSGAVVDFIDVTWFAIFNVADIFVVCGVIVFALFELLSHRHSELAGEQPSPPNKQPSV